MTAWMVMLFQHYCLDNGVPMRPVVTNPYFLSHFETMYFVYYVHALSLTSSASS